MKIDFTTDVFGEHCDVQAEVFNNKISYIKLDGDNYLHDFDTLPKFLIDAIYQRAKEEGVSDE